MSWLTGHPPSATTASKVGQRPGVGKADLTIGAYTMFGGI
jgi:hypothetical protein